MARRGATRRSLLVLWIGLACALLWVMAPAPEPPKEDPEGDAVRQRLTNWAVRDARRWQQTEGDLGLPWDQAEGHLAIVIDDVGRELRYHQGLQALPFRLTFSVLPGSVYVAGAQARLAADRRRYREILLHLPMEPLDPAQMEAGAEAQENFLRTDDDPGDLRSKLEAALAAVPAAVGVNNHMGSKLSADGPAMDAIMPTLRERGLFFLDSRTTAATVVGARARAAGVPTVSRQVFLDHDPSPDAVRRGLLEAAARSKDVPTVAIAHPSRAVLDVLREELPRLYEDGVTIYPLSALVRRQAAVEIPSRPDISVHFPTSNERSEVESP